ncbi:hypothetical protein E1258_04660 [Micromonospora sp. KC207]|nr:hypothetical protein E1258_04660 [Micromonospora sp. KC207]
MRQLPRYGGGPARTAPVWCYAAARSATLRSTQNSLPSGSASVTQPVPSGRRWSSKSFAPIPISRSTSSSRVRS